MDSMLNSEYVFLSSDVDSDAYAKSNTPSNFIVPLSKPLELTPDWEVGLGEISIPKLIYNIVPPLDRAIVIAVWEEIKDDDDNLTGYAKRRYRLRIRPGRYTPSTYAEHVNYRIDRVNDERKAADKTPLYGGHIKYESNTGKMAFVVHGNDEMSITHPLLAKMLGFAMKDPKVVKLITYRNKRELVGMEVEEEGLVAVDESDDDDQKSSTAISTVGVSASRQADSSSSSGGGGGGQQQQRKRKRSDSGATVQTNNDEDDSDDETNTIITISKMRMRATSGRRVIFHPRRVCNFDISGAHMYVYADVAEYSRVGNTEAPLLRVVPLHTYTTHGQSDKYDVIHRVYTNIQYTKLRVKSITTIHIRLCDPYGEDITFLEGGASSLIVLHFKRRIPHGKE